MEDRDLCLFCHPKPQPRKVLSIGRTTYFHPKFDLSVLQEIADIVDRALEDERISWHQRGVVYWALGKCREIAADDSKSLDVEEL
jgi:hypothetical protein